VSRIYVVASLVLPLVVGLAATVALTLSVEASYGDLDTGDRASLLAASVFLPAACYAFSALVAVCAHYVRPLSAAGLLVCVVVGSALAVALWPLFTR
jgi:hypothetical protein